MYGLVVQATREVDAADDVAPLIVTANLQATLMFAVQGSMPTLLGLVELPLALLAWKLN